MRARGLSKRLGPNLAVADATFELPARGVVGLVGPNGAGKTTTIRLIAGVFAPDAGTLEVGGFDARRDAARARSVVGYLPEAAPLPPELTAREVVRFRARLAGVSATERDRAVERALGRCDAARFADRCCGTLSKGMQQRVGLAAAIVGDPRVLILDEPSVGLDPEQLVTFRELVRELGASRLVVFSTHLLVEVESLCERLVVLARGRVVADEAIDSFRARATRGAPLVAVTERGFLGSSDARALCMDPVERRLEDGWVRTSFRPAGGGAADERLARLLLREGIAARAIGFEAVPLEEIFGGLIRGEAASPERSPGSSTGPAPAAHPPEAAR